MFRLSKKGLDFVKEELKRYETRRSAVIPALFWAQKENGGWINSEVIEHLSEVMELPVTQIEEVAHFYTMFNHKAVGKYQVQVCCNISCAMNEGRELVASLLQELQVELGQVTSDGRFSVHQVECLGSCGTAPVMQVNETYYEQMTPAKAMEILKELK